MTATAYTTIALVKASLDVSGNADDTELTRIVAAASDWVDRYCGVLTGSFAPAESTRYYSSENLAADGDIRLDQPLLSLTSVTDGFGAVVDSNNLVLFPLNGLLKWRIHRLDGAWGVDEYENFVTVVGKFGMSLTVPEGISEATIMLSAWIYKRYQAALQDATANAELGTVIYGESMPKQVRELLKPFRIGTRML